MRRKLAVAGFFSVLSLLAGLVFLLGQGTITHWPWKCAARGRKSFLEFTTEQGRVASHDVRPSGCMFLTNVAPSWAPGSTDQSTAVPVEAA